MLSSVRAMTTLLLLSVLAACAASPGRVQQVRQVDEINNEKGVALQGYDPVAYFKDGKPVEGLPANSTTWQGATYHFASVQNRDAFRADPERYAPQFGGYCAFAVSRGTTANGDPHQWAIVDDRLFLNNNAFAMTLWNRDRPGNIKAGVENWPLIAKRPLRTPEHGVQGSPAVTSSTQE